VISDETALNTPAFTLATEIALSNLTPAAENSFANEKALYFSVLQVIMLRMAVSTPASFNS